MQYCSGMPADGRVNKCLCVAAIYTYTYTYTYVHRTLAEVLQRIHGVMRHVVLLRLMPGTKDDPGLKVMTTQ